MPTLGCGVYVWLLQELSLGTSCEPWMIGMMCISVVVFVLCVQNACSCMMSNRVILNLDGASILILFIL